jgi:hypothetical protein
VVCYASSPSAERRISPPQIFPTGGAAIESPFRPKMFTQRKLTSFTLQDSVTKMTVPSSGLLRARKSKSAGSRVNISQKKPRRGAGLKSPIWQSTPALGVGTFAVIRRRKS